MSGEEERVKRLLTWAGLLAAVAVVVLVIDFGLKNSIVREVARGRSGTHGEDQQTVIADHHPVDGVDDGAPTPAAPTADGGR